MKTPSVEENVDQYQVLKEMWKVYAMLVGYKLMQ